jgi:hypothetical protein
MALPVDCKMEANCNVVLQNYACPNEEQIKYPVYIGGTKRLIIRKNLKLVLMIHEIVSLSQSTLRPGYQYQYCTLLNAWYSSSPRIIHDSYLEAHYS